MEAEAEAEGDVQPADLRRDAEALLHDIALVADGVAPRVADQTGHSHARHASTRRGRDTAL